MELEFPSVTSVRVFFVEPFGRPRFRFTGFSVGQHNSRILFFSSMSLSYKQLIYTADI